MTADGPILALENLSVSFDGPDGIAREVLSGISFTVQQGEILGVVGESGSGKSVTALAIMRLLGAQGRIIDGAISFRGRDLVGLDERSHARSQRPGHHDGFPGADDEPEPAVHRRLPDCRGTAPSSSGFDRATSRARVIELLGQVGIPDASSRVDDYPHVLSGGMRQRVMIAMAMACAPALLIADEPTTALDVTIQAQILDLMRDLRAAQGAAILLITHDMGVIARMADRVVVMYAGQIVELALLADLFERQAHPYTRLLMAAMPTVRHRLATLPAIRGSMPAPGQLPSGCRFHPRCPLAIDVCRTTEPALSPVGPARAARCHRANDMLAGALA